MLFILFLATSSSALAGCTYEGLVYIEGQEVLVPEEPCLNCTCHHGSLVCYLRVCPQLPDPPPPHCVLVHRNQQCCAELVCADGEFSKHKEDVTLREPDVQNDRGCILNGTVYGEGSAMHTSELCNYCFCIKGQEECVQPRCLLPLEGCKPTYSDLSCCPTRYNCSEAIAGEMTTTSVAPTNFVGCEVNGQLYAEGEMIQQVARTECDNCFCLKGKVQCVELECAPPLQGCVPVVTLGKCCPDSYNCDGEDELENTQDIYPVYNHLDAYPDTSSLTRKQTSSVRSLMKSQNNHQYQITGEGRSNNDESSTVTELSETSTETSTITTETTSQQTEATTVTTEVTADTTTVVLQTTLEVSSECNKNTQVQERIMTTTLGEEEEGLPMTMETETTFMTSIPTTMIIPHDINVANITVHSNVTIAEKEENNTATNMSLPPVRSIPAEIEAILNITHKKDDDYEYDYNEPSLPPSLPNLRIIPFVAADAVPEDHDNVDRVTVYSTQNKLRATDNPLYYKVSHPNRFSPPIETEGGFVPREPILDGPFYESKYEAPYHTTGLNIPDITAGTIIPPSITMLPKTDDEHCLSGGREYRHGQIISEPSACIMCMCYYGEVLCQETKCPHVKTGCRRLKDKDHGLCCGRVICDEGESPTVVLDRIDITPNPLQPPPHLLGGIVPPITVADGVVTPDPFRDVIRTEPAPDLPSLIGDMMPYLLERHTTSSTTTNKPSTSTTTEEQISPGTPGIGIKDTVDSLEEKIINDSEGVDELEKDDDDVMSGLSFDTVLQYLFSGGETTKIPPKSSTTTQSFQESTAGTSQVIYNTTEMTSENVTNSTEKIDVTSEGNDTNVLNSIGPTTSSKEPPPGRPPNLEVLPTTTDAAGLGVLKLAGCNIYGRMYRVGRIISELSGPCLECMCTEVGVQCRALDC